MITALPSPFVPSSFVWNVRLQTYQSAVYIKNTFVILCYLRFISSSILFPSPNFCNISLIDGNFWRMRGSDQSTVLGSGRRVRGGGRRNWSEQIGTKTAKPGVCSSHLGPHGWRHDQGHEASLQKLWERNWMADGGSPWSRGLNRPWDRWPKQSLWKRGGARGMIVSPVQQEVDIVKGMAQGTGLAVAAASGLEKKGEVGLVEQRSFVGWKYGPCREKKLKIALLNETNFKVKFKFKVENCVLQISLDHKFGSNICNIYEGSTRPFYFFISGIFGRT